MMDDTIWINKEVYVKTFYSRNYKGFVIREDNNSITIKDIKNKIVRINKRDISLLQEEDLKVKGGSR